MKNIFKNKVVTAIIVITTVVLAGIAIFTAIRLYQLRQETVVPTQPQSVPKAVVQDVDDTDEADAIDPLIYGDACESLIFDITDDTKASCNEDCEDDADCEGDLVCYEEKCRNDECKDDTNCVCPGETVTPTPTATATATAAPTATPTSTPGTGGVSTTPTPTVEPSLPKAGIGTPTIIGVGSGIILLFISLALAL